MIRYLQTSRCISNELKYQIFIICRLKKDLQDCNDQREVAYMHAKKKHSQEISELNDINTAQAKSMLK